MFVYIFENSIWPSEQQFIWNFFHYQSSL